MENKVVSEILYNVETSPSLGRFLVAACDIEEGQIIISEEPLLSAPSDSPRCQNVPATERCLGCCLEIPPGEKRRCTKCFFPCCTVNCEQLTAHADNECSFFIQHHATYPLLPQFSAFYKSIMVLRALLLKSKDSQKWESLMTMESHFDLRRNKPNASNLDEKVIENIKYFFGTEARVDSDEIRRISGIIDVNAHLLPQQINGKSSFTGVCHIFGETSLLCHSCVPNAAWSVSTASETTLVTRASVSIPKGTQITVSYDVGEALYGTLRRIIPLEVSGLFVCGCARCVDPTELGTHLSTLICDRCHFGYVLPDDPTDSFSIWVCQNCSEKKADEDVLELLECLESEIKFPQPNLFFSRVEESTKVLEDFKSKWSGTVLHPNHYILLQVNFRWVKQHSVTNFENITTTEIQSTFLRTCRQLIELSRVILPGASEFKAILQFHLYQGLSHLRTLNGGTTVFDAELKETRQGAMSYFKRNIGFESFITKMEVMSRIRENDSR